MSTTKDMLAELRQHNNLLKEILVGNHLEDPVDNFKTYMAIINSNLIDEYLINNSNYRPCFCKENSDISVKYQIVHKYENGIYVFKRQQPFVLSNMPFDMPEAIYSGVLFNAQPNTITPTYYIEINKQTFVNNDIRSFLRIKFDIKNIGSLQGQHIQIASIKNFMDVLQWTNIQEKDKPVKGKLYFYDDENKSLTPVSQNIATIQFQAVDERPESDISLGAMSWATTNGAINSGTRVAYGYANYNESLLRQYLNGKGDDWWKPQNKWDQPFASDLAGFLGTLDEEIQTNALPIENANNDQIFIPSMSEMNVKRLVTNIVEGEEQTQIEIINEDNFWKNYIGSQQLIKSPWNEYKPDGQSNQPWDYYKTLAQRIYKDEQDKTFTLGTTHKIPPDQETDDEDILNAAAILNLAPIWSRTTSETQTNAMCVYSNFSATRAFIGTVTPDYLTAGAAKYAVYPCFLIQGE